MLISHHDKIIRRNPDLHILKPPIKVLIHAFYTSESTVSYQKLIQFNKTKKVITSNVRVSFCVPFETLPSWGC